MSGEVGLPYHVSEERARPPAARRYRSMAAKKRARAGREIAISSLGYENERARKNKWIGWRSARFCYLLLLCYAFMLVFMPNDAYLGVYPFQKSESDLMVT